MNDVDVINQRLEDYYGREIDGRAHYRVVWSTSQIETRIGEFNEFYGSIYLRTFKGVKQLPKYPFDKDRWVVEKLMYIRNDEILADKPGSYEPFYVCKGPDGEFLPLNWKVVDFVVSYAEAKPVGIKLTDKDTKAEEEKELLAEAAYFEEELHDRGRSPLFAFENSVFVDSTKRL
jgi:hypothetical protein